MAVTAGNTRERGELGGSGAAPYAESTGGPGRTTRLAPYSQMYDTEGENPVAQVNAVFNATNQTVLRELGDFARGRTPYNSAMREERFLMDADLYARFVCHAMVRRLIEVERERLFDR